MLLDLDFLAKIEEFMDSGDLAFEFENGDEDKRQLILEFLEKFMDVAEKADALATAVFVMGPDRGKKFVEGIPGARCFIITRTGSREASRGWDDLHKG